MTQDDGRVAEATGLSQVEPQSSQGLDPSGFDPSRDISPETLLIALRQGRKARPVGWTDKTIFRGGYCFVRDLHTFVQHTPYTVGVSVSPAIAGACEAIRQFGTRWVEV